MEEDHHGGKPYPKKRRRDADAPSPSGRRGGGRGGRYGRGNAGGRGRGRSHYDGDGHGRGRGGRGNGNFYAGGRNGGRGRPQGGGYSYARGGRGGGGGGRHGASNGYHRQGSGQASMPPGKYQINARGDPVANVVSGASSETSSLANDSDAASSSIQQRDDTSGKVITTLPWPDPSTHYIPIEEEERLLPALVHWGESERGMMKDQPPFRLQKLQRMVVTQSNSQRNRQSTSQRMSLIQSLSLRRTHLKLLNPTYSMSALRLGNEEDVRNAAALFEACVDAYLRSHGVQYWTEEDQRKKFDEKMKGVPFYQRRQPPTPDFMMKEGHTVSLSFGDVVTLGKSDGANRYATTHPTSINWIEAKMFYGASTVPAGTPNAVGCIIPKMQQYVSLYGTGAIIFMYGCGSQLAAQLMEVGVVALDGRCLDLEQVESHQRGWCADCWGNILF